MGEKGTLLRCGEYLQTNEYLVSENKLFFAIMQSDGNFCVYRGSGPSDNQGVLWAANKCSETKSDFFAIVQNDGNFCVYKGTGPSDNHGIWWDTHEIADKGDFFGIIQNDGNFCIYKGSGPSDNHGVLWDTHVIDSPDAFTFSDACPFGNEDDTLKDLILKKHAPLIWLANNEKFLPSSVDWAFKQMVRYPKPDNALIPLPAAIKTGKYKYCLKAKEKIEDPSDSSLDLFKGDLDSAKIYAFWVTKNKPIIDLVYFFFYPYNRGKEVANTMFGNHVGDWEHLTVRLKRASFGTNQVVYRPTDVYYPYHNKGNSYAWPTINKCELTHPIGYSAKGSHGMWKSSGAHLYEGLKDHCSEGTEWQTWNGIETFDYNLKKGVSTTWPAWMSTNYTDPGSGDPSLPGNGPIYRWGNSHMGMKYYKYYRLSSGPTGPAAKSSVWEKDSFR
nr:Vps62-related protein [uncultured Desulfobacter sp.]